MAKHAKKQNARLERRQSGYVAGKNGSTKFPGSLNPHKHKPSGRRKRSHSQVKADSRKATV